MSENSSDKESQFVNEVRGVGAFLGLLLGTAYEEDPFVGAIIGLILGAIAGFIAGSVLVFAYRVLVFIVGLLLVLFRIYRIFSAFGGE